MRNVKIPILSIEVQKDIVDMHNAYIMRKEISEQMKTQIKDICPIPIRGIIRGRY